MLLTNMRMTKIQLLYLSSRALRNVFTLCAKSESNLLHNCGSFNTFFHTKVKTKCSKTYVPLLESWRPIRDLCFNLVCTERICLEAKRGCSVEKNNRSSETWAHSGIFVYYRNRCLEFGVGHGPPSDRTHSDVDEKISAGLSSRSRITKAPKTSELTNTCALPKPGKLCPCKRFQVTVLLGLS